MGSTKQIFFDAERMKYPHTGLYHYCFNLAQALINIAIKNEESVKLFVPKEAANCFNNTGNIIVKNWHKFFLPNANIDVWHATHQDTNYFPFKKKVPVVLTVHDLNYFNDEKKPLQKRTNFLRQLQKKVDRSQHLTFISKYTLEDFEKHIQIKNKPVTVIHNGCNIQEIGQLKRPTINVSTPFIFTIGTITDKKNFHVLPALLVNNNYHLIIAGVTQSPAYKNRIIEEAVKLNVISRITFTGAISENDKQWYYKNCTAFVFPSIAEGFGLPVIEAMYFGKPVFLSNYTSLPEIGGNAAYYFNSFDPQHMQHVLEDGLNDYTSNNRMEIIKQNAARFNWTDAAEAYLNVYRSLY